MLLALGFTLWIYNKELCLHHLRGYLPLHRGQTYNVHQNDICLVSSRDRRSL